MNSVGVKAIETHRARGMEKPGLRSRVAQNPLRSGSFQEGNERLPNPSNDVNQLRFMAKSVGILALLTGLIYLRGNRSLPIC